jgi:hypothetical protein
MPQRPQRRVPHRLVEGSAGIGLLVGWRVAVGESMPSVACPRTGTASTQLSQCFNHSLVATVLHWGIPMLVGFIIAGTAAVGLLLALRRLRARPT